MSNTIFRYEWIGLNTKWNYRLDIYKADTTVLNNPTITHLPPGSLKINTLDTAFKSNRLGIPKIPLLKLNVILSNIPETIIYDEFHTTIANPALELDYINMGVFWIKYDTGTVFRLYCDFKNNSDTTNFREIFTGIQRTGLKGTFSPPDNIIELEIEDIKYITLSQIPTADVMKMVGLRTDNEIKRAVNYTIYKHSGTTTFVVSSPSMMLAYELGDFNSLRFQDPYIKLASLDGTFEEIGKIAKTMHYAILRETAPVDETFTIDSSHIVYYQQLKDGTGDRGAQLNRNQLKYIFEIKSNARTVDGILKPEVIFHNMADEASIKDSFASSFPFIWDFLTDYCQSQLAKADLLSGATYFGMQSIYYYIDEIELKQQDLCSFEIDNIGDSSLTNVTASLFESKGDDIAKSEQNYKTPKSGESLNLPIIFNNMGPNIYLQSSEMTVYSGGVDPETNCYSNPAGLNENYHCWKPLLFKYWHLFDLFYMDSGIYYGNQTMPLKVHEYVTVNISQGENSSSLVPLSPFGITLPFNYISNRMPTEMYTDMQNKTFSPAILSKVLLNIFKSKKLTAIKISCSIDKYTNFKEGGSVGFVWWNRIFDTNFILDVGRYYSKLAYLGDSWFPSEVSIDFNTEIASVKLINEVI